MHSVIMKLHHLHSTDYLHGDDEADEMFEHLKHNVTGRFTNVMRHTENTGNVFWFKQHR